jgi:L-lactate dehydrogenase
VRRAAYSIIEGKGATYYGIGSALARIVNVILNDQRAILTVCSPVTETWGGISVTVSLPHLVGGDGVLDTFLPVLARTEEELLHTSFKVVRAAIKELDEPSG